MARARNIKPGFYRNAELAECSIWARFIFPGLWMLADREGRLEDKPKQIKMELLAADPGDVDQFLQELVEQGFIARYEADGKRLIQVLNFDKHQNPHVKEPPSTLPAMTLSGASLVQDWCKTGAGTSVAGLIVDSLIPDSLIPDSLIPDPLTLKPEKSKPKVKNLPTGASLPAAPTAETWAAYCESYENAYGAKPVRNAQVNGQLAQLVARLGAAEAPEVARWFLRHRNGLYVSAMHPTNLLLRDCEKLRTEWATGRQVTRTQAQQQDRTQTNLSAFSSMLAEAEQRELLNGKC